MPPPIRPTPIIRPPTGSGDTTPFLIKPGAMEFTDRLGSQTARLTFLVEGVAGAGPRVLLDALRAPAIPRVGDVFEGSNIIVTSRIVTNVEDCNTKWEIVVNYGETVGGGGGPFINPPDDQATPMLEIDSTVVMKRTNIDVDGNVIQIEGYHAEQYDENTGEPLGIENPVAEPIQGGMVDVPIPMTVLRFMRREPPVDQHGRGVAFKSMLYTGKTNIEPIVDIGRFREPSQAHTWLCTRLGAVSDDGGLTFNVTYEFTFNPDRWRATAVYIDPKTGQPGDNLHITDSNTMSGNGVKTFQVVGAENFHLLDLFI